MPARGVGVIRARTFARMHQGEPANESAVQADAILAIIGGPVQPAMKPLPAGTALFADPAARVLVFGGLVLLIINMLLGEMFAIFISHVANGEIRRLWGDVVSAASQGQAEAVQVAFERIAVLFDRRGRIMNAHSHAGAFGMLALLLALLQSFISAGPRLRVALAVLVVAGGLVQPLFIFVSHYTGGWAFLVSDAGAVAVIIGVAGSGLLLRPGTSGLLRERVALLLAPGSARLLLRFGSLLMLVGMVFGLGYAWVFTSVHEPLQFELAGQMLAAAGSEANADTVALVRDYRTVNSRIAILTAVHSHAIEMGLIALFLAFIQRFVYFTDRTRRRWAIVFLVGAWALPFCIFNATIFGLVSAAFADLSGFLALVALIAMLSGLVRRTGADAVAVGGSP